MKSCKFLLLFLLLAVDCFGAGLADLQEQAVTNRQVVEKYRQALERAGHDETAARSPYYPSVDLSYTANLLDDDTFLEHRDNSVVYGAVRWNVFSGWRDRYGLRAAHWQTEAEAGRLNAIKQEIRLAVALRYLAIYAAGANLLVAQDSFSSLQKVLRDSENRFQAGLTRKNDLLKSQVDLDNAGITLKRAAAEVDRGWRLLAREVGAEPDREQLAFSEFDDLPVLPGPEELERQLLAGRSELRVLAKQAAAADEQVGLELASRYPRVDLTGSYRRYEDHPLAGFGDDTEEEVRNQLVVSYNLFDGFARQARVARAGAQARAVRQELAELQAELTTELYNLYQDFQVECGNVAAAAGGIIQAEENLRVTRLAYDEGLETEANLLDAVAGLTRARSNLAAAKRAVFDNYFRILRTTEGF